MRSKIWKLICVCLIMTVLFAGRVAADVSEESEYQVYKIGVVVYDVQDNEVQMFRDYYQGYITDSFSVEFVYSPNVLTWEDEEAFLTEKLEEGVRGFISFNPTNLSEAIRLCEEKEAYYMLGSGNISQEIFEAVEENPWFLGCIGPDEATDYQAGADMVDVYAKSHEDKEVHFLIATGGAAAGNYMHEMRARGILEELQEVYGYQYTEEIDKIVMATEPYVLETGGDGIRIAISPGYDADEKLKQTFDFYDPDAVLSVLALNSIEEIVGEQEKKANHDIWIGIIDCFSAWNQYMFREKDRFGNSKLNYVSGKYGSIIGPSFAAMFQALTGGTEMLRPEGKAFHINQGFWTAASQDEYDILYGYNKAYAVNPYSSVDLMQVIQIYNEDADFAAFKELAEAYTVEQALLRMGM